MHPNPKISQTLYNSAISMVNQLTRDFTTQELETMMSFVITVWNAVTIDTQQEKALLAAIRLIKSKKTKFSRDIRAVGEQ